MLFALVELIRKKGPWHIGVSINLPQSRPLKFYNPDDRDSREGNLNGLERQGP